MGKNIVFVLVSLVVIIGSLIGINILSEKAEDSGPSSIPDLSSVTAEPVEGFDYKNQPSLGEEDAPIKIIEFGDYKCPYCKQWHETIYPRLKEEYINTGKVEFYFANLPFIGQDSTIAANAGESVLAQSEKAFWNFHEAVYDNQGEETVFWADQEFLYDLAKEETTGLDYNKLQEDVEEYTYIENVKRDELITKNLGIRSTPSIFVNGEEMENIFDYNAYKAKLDALLEKEVGTNE